jgi:hypothetical protein
MPWYVLWSSKLIQILFKNLLLYLLKTHCAFIFYKHQPLNYWEPSGSFMFYQLYLSKFYILPTQCVYEFCVDLTTNSNISLYNINWLVITAAECVYCAVRTAYIRLRLRSLITFRWLISVLSGAFAKLRKATISFVVSVRPSVCPHGTTRLPLDGFSWNLMSEYFFFSKFCRKNSSFI